MCQNLIGKYAIADRDKRFEYIYNNYSEYCSILISYKRGLIYRITTDKEYNRASHHDDLGVRVKSGSGQSDPTAAIAMSRAMIEQYIDTGWICEDLLSDLDNPDDIAYKVKEYYLMKMEYETFDEALKENWKYSDLLTDYLINQIEISQIADDRNITNSSARKMVSRAKQELKYMVVPFMKEIGRK